MSKSKSFFSSPTVLSPELAGAFVEVAFPQEESPPANRTNARNPEITVFFIPRFFFIVFSLSKSKSKRRSSFRKTEPDTDDLIRYERASLYHALTEKSRKFIIFQKKSEIIRRNPRFALDRRTIFVYNRYEMVKEALVRSKNRHFRRIGYRIFPEFLCPKNPEQI